ncbi:MAG: replication initiation protein [Christensenellaceae bacterium]
MEKRKKEKQLVIKDNSLIQVSKMTMALNEMKAFSYIIAQIPDFNDIQSDKFISFRKADFCRACDIEEGNGGNNAHLKRTLRKLLQRVVEIDTNDKWEAFQVLSKAEIIYNSETVRVKINDSMKPLIYNLKERFTTYQLENVLALKSKYAFRLYEWLKSFHTGEAVCYIGKLKTLFGVKYQRTIDLIKFCVEPAVAEINAKTDLFVSYTRKKTGRVVSALSFNIKEKSELEAIDVTEDPSQEFKIVHIEHDGTPTTIIKEKKDDIQNLINEKGFEKEKTMIFQIINEDSVNISEQFVLN